jgi:hypothetical protein
MWQTAGHWLVHAMLLLKVLWLEVLLLLLVLLVLLLIDVFRLVGCAQVVAATGKMV